MSEKYQKNLNNSRLDTMDSSVVLNSYDLNTEQFSILFKAIELSHHLNPTPDINTLNPVRYMFCLEYFFSIYKEQRRITNTERFMIFDKEKYVHTSVLVNFLAEYKRDVGELYQRREIDITADSFIDGMDKKVLIAIKKIWNETHDKQMEAIPRENISELIDRVCVVFNLNRENHDINKDIYNWKSDLSYFVIFEEFAALMRRLNAIQKLKLITKHKNCNGCTIF